MIWFVVVSGFFSILFSLVQTTRNFASAMFYKVIPFFLGLGCLIYSAKYFNIL